MVNGEKTNHLAYTNVTSSDFVQCNGTKLYREPMKTFAQKKSDQKATLPLYLKTKNYFFGNGAPTATAQS